MVPVEVEAEAEAWDADDCCAWSWPLQLPGFGEVDGDDSWA